MNHKFLHHFWNWFQSNSQVLLHLPDMDRKQKEFWLLEIDVHLKAYSRKLSYELVQDPNGLFRIIITADGDSRYFRMAEIMAAKAPAMPEWQVMGLHQPGLYRSKILRRYEHLGNVYNKCWFLPPVKEEGREKFLLRAFVEELKPMIWEIAVEEIIYDLLGEKTMGLTVEYIDVVPLSFLLPGEKEKLLPIEELPGYVRHHELSSTTVDGSGMLQPPPTDRSPGG